MMKGLTWSSLKKHYSLIPLFVILGGGCALSAAYLARLAFKNPEVSWRRSANPEPYQEYAEKRYKLLHIKEEPDYKKIKEQRPEF
ncbi:cytochrome c oxidase subunit NDUFA4 [Parasteatoda tepidariorum]|uniref:cytochrome c oxidase subunit NDUFA4 n=1 Tax=Parasteatoda tepidariorum TaxID=114398 RepID=UPI00077FDA61|nr:cytochrome c oxidase subunit NDUFA4 [Parasteatoda tepidariorum]